MLAGLVDFVLALRRAPRRAGRCTASCRRPRGALAAAARAARRSSAALGVGLWLAALNVRYRDVRYVVPFLDPDLAVRDAGRLSEQPAHRAVADGVRRSTRWSAWSRASAGRCSAADAPRADDRASRRRRRCVLLVGGRSTSAGSSAASPTSSEALPMSRSRSGPRDSASATASVAQPTRLRHAARDARRAVPAPLRGRRSSRRRQRADRRRRFWALRDVSFDDRSTARSSA